MYFRPAYEISSVFPHAVRITKEENAAGVNIALILFLHALTTARASEKARNLRDAAQQPHGQREKGQVELYRRKARGYLISVGPRRACEHFCEFSLRRARRPKNVKLAASARHKEIRERRAARLRCFYRRLATAAPLLSRACSAPPLNARK